MEHSTTVYNKERKIELLSPAGNMERLKTAFLYGADACYIGGREFSLRANAKNFSNDEIKEAVNYAHSLGKKIYVTVNIVFHNENMDGIVNYLKFLSSVEVDAIIVSDPFIIDIVKDNNINLSIHISTQYSVLNTEAALFFEEMGVERVVLAREASRENIKNVIDKTGIEVETFVHGAMCSGYSGRCVLSNYFTNRDANRGGCAQVCRWEFDLYDKNKHKINADTKFTMSTKDLSMIDNIGDMIDIGISSLKVEGRMRSDYYVATVINTYKSAIEDYYAGMLTLEKKEYYKKVLEKVSNRDNIEQFYNKPAGVNEQYYLGRQEESNQDFLGVVLDYDDNTGLVKLEERNFFKKGDMVEFFGPNISVFSFQMGNIYNEDGEILECARHPKEIILFKVPQKVYQNDILRIKI